MTARSKEFLFSVIVPTYNVEPWIDTFFMSLVKQTSGLDDIIQVIVVDDGSTDSSSDLAKKWAAQYPDNIMYVRKENGGLSSARNYGLQFVRGKWVTFTDPDDFLHEDYFVVVKNFLERSQFDGILVGCNLIMYNEVRHEFSNTHPLNFKFTEDETIVSLVDRPELIHLSAASCFLDFNALKQSGLLFESKVKPNFEDAHLINKLFIERNDYKVAYLKNAIYYYRRRQLANSLFSSSWRRWEKYQDQLFYGCLDLVKYSKDKLGNVPEFVQNLIIYETRAYVNRILENGLDYSFSKKQVQIFMDMMVLLYGYIEAKHILFSKLPVLPWRTRIAMLSAFKNMDLPEAPAIVHEIAPDKRSMLVVRYGKAREEFFVCHGERKTKPLWEKTVCRNFYDVPFCVEQYFWVPISDEESVSLKTNDQTVAIIAGEELFTEITARDVLGNVYCPESALPERIQALRNAAELPENIEKFGECWLFMDRQDKADDNAEHMYRWMMRNSDNRRKIYYVLDRRSTDWDRLAKEGFNLIPHRSRRFYLALFNAEWVFSSHYQPHVFDPMYIRDIFGVPNYKFAFLQHGIILHDMSKWFSNKRIDLFVTSTEREYDSLIHGSYKYTEREVVLTGLPRHDELLRKRAGAEREKVIMVCPTWRDHLCRPHTHDKPDPNEAACFMESDYYRNWNALTSSGELDSIAQAYGYRFIFLPHPHTSRLASLFKYSDCFVPLRYSELESFQDIMAKSAMVITDYSSVGMEAGFAGIPLLYYQFKETPDFFSCHTSVEGYFDYEKDGFGPVAHDISELVEHLKQNMITSYVHPEMYEVRAKEFFAFRDENNCRRVYAEIMHKSASGADINSYDACMCISN